MNKNEICIVIVIYKEILNDYEIRSIEQCVKVLSEYSINFVAPEELNVDFYKTKFPQIVNYTFFNKDYFIDVAAYNRLMLSPNFYKAFEKYEYMLIYQTDCYVFRDELLDWARKGYDYIGAPWIKTNLYHWMIYHNYPVNLKVYHILLGMGIQLSRVGNGGFSLRRTKAILKNLSRFKNAAASWKLNEDSFFSHYVKTFNPAFKIPDVDVTKDTS